MKPINPTLVSTIAYYDPLLQRYARRLVKDATVAADLVKQVFEVQYKLDGLMPSGNLRQLLKTDLRNHCYYWNQSQIFDRPLVKVPVRKYAELSIKNKKKATFLSKLLFL